jgi:hypothetical protein
MTKQTTLNNITQCYWYERLYINKKETYKIVDNHQVEPNIVTNPNIILGADFE